MSITLSFQGAAVIRELGINYVPFCLSASVARSQGEVMLYVFRDLAGVNERELQSCSPEPHLYPCKCRVSQWLSTSCVEAISRTGVEVLGDFLGVCVLLLSFRITKDSSYLVQVS